MLGCDNAGRGVGLRRGSTYAWRTKELKRRSRQALTRNFAVCFLACIILGFLSANPSAFSENTNETVELLKSVAGVAPDTPLASAANDLLKTINQVKSSTALGTDSSAGVISTIYTGVRAAGSMGKALLDFVNSTMLDNRLSMTVISGGGMAVTIALFFFVSEILLIGSQRLFLENRLYPKTSLSRLFFIYQVRKLFPAARIVFLKYVRLFLWAFTIIGFPLKYYSYYLVGFIQAENPDVPSRTIFRLSENMMRGHRFRVFLFDLSFTGWYLLSLLTFGLVGYIWLNPYRAAAQAELYATLRAFARQRGLAHVEYLRDDALFVVPVVEGSATVDLSHAETDAEPGTYPYIQHHPWEKRLHGTITIEPRRRYSMLNLVLMFFLFSFIGWTWECLIAFAQSGEFINRGSLYGPWIPIYGFGGVTILVLLNRFNKRPLLCFFAAIVLCGIIEYASATVIWNLYHLKYWDYSGYFFNIQGRICLEGLLAFGILGMVGLYLIAPLTDSLLEAIPKSLRQRICVALAVAFGTDVVVAAFIPHTGDGITNRK
jgi:uncharacterized membrane protein